MVYAALLPLMRTPRLPVSDWTDTPADLNGLVRFAGRRNLVSARVPSHFTCSLTWNKNKPNPIYTLLWWLVLKKNRTKQCKDIRPSQVTWHQDKSDAVPPLDPSKILQANICRYHSGKSNTTLMQDHTTNRLHSASAYYHWVQNAWSTVSSMQGKTLPERSLFYRRVSPHRSNRCSTDGGRVDCHVQFVNCFFGLISYLTHTHTTQCIWILTFWQRSFTFTF
jgi:hypothetical protein